MSSPHDSPPCDAAASSSHTEQQIRAPDGAEESAPESSLPRSPAAPPPPPPPLNIQTLTDHALRFLSTATNETLGACLLGLGATTYLVLGRLGLVLIGVVGGIVLHAQWESTLHGYGDGKTRAAEERRRKEVGLDVIKRVLDVREQSKENAVARERDAELDIQLFSGKQLDYSNFRPETSAALSELTDAVIRDYVKWWYSPILPAEMTFPTACRQTLTAFIISISNHLSRKRPADFFLEYLTHSSAITVVFLDELSGAMSASPSAPPAEAVQTYLKLKPDSKLANVLDRTHQAKKFDAVAEDILENYLEPKTYNCRPARAFLTEILAKVVLEMTVTTCSKPEWINGWIVYLLEEGEPEIMKEIDASVEGSTERKLEDVKDQVESAEATLKQEKSEEQQQSEKTHRRVVSKAQEAMDDAMREAQRLTQMIVEEEQRKSREKEEKEKLERGKSSTSLSDDHSEGTTQGAVTPTSSQSDQNEERPLSLHDSVMMRKPNTKDSETTRDASAESSQKTSSEENKRPSSSESKHSETFTSFDQIVSSPKPTALGGRPQSVSKPSPLTLYNASISMFDDSLPGDKSVLKSKPVGDYFVQIEPASSQHPGWMISRKYADFETLHEVLRRISVIAGVGFTEAHSTLPGWKGHTKTSLRGELERYINDAASWQPLAESEGLKRFLEKDNGTASTPINKGLSWPSPAAFESMGKGMFDTLTRAPNQVAGGGKAFFGGVTGVFGALGPKRRTTNATNDNGRSDEPPPTSFTPTNRHKRAESTVSELPNPTHMRSESMLSIIAPGRRSQESLRSPSGRRSQDSLRNSPIVDQQPAPIAQMERRPSYNPDSDAEFKPRPNSSSRSSMYGRSSKEHSRNPSRTPSARESFDISPLMGGDQILNLPPPPSDITDDYGTVAAPPSPEQKRTSTRQSDDLRRLSRASTAAASTLSESGQTSSPPKAPRPQTISEQPAAWQLKAQSPLNEQETQMAVELFFAIINQLYTLSSAWQIRKTLLGAAKTFLLRPGNPQLESIRALLQDTVLEANWSDEGVAGHLRKLRANTLPTAEELKAWPAAPMGDEEKKKLRVKARKLLVERGMPQALTSVMGQAASGEALGRVFDCLQVEDVARGFMFGLLLQGVRAVTA